MRLLNLRLLCLMLVALLSAIPCPGQQREIRKLFPVEKDGKWGFIDSTGKVVIPLEFDSANEFHEGLALVTTGKQKALIDTSGRIVFKPQFDLVNNFSEGLAAVNIGQTRIANLGLIGNPGRWGYIDKTGKLAIPPRFTHAEDFSEGLAAVTEGDRSGFIDHKSKIVFEVPLDVTLGFHGGVVGVLFKGDVKYFDRSGKKISPPIDYGPKSYSFSEGLVPVASKGKWGFMDKTGKLVIAAQFEDAENFSEGLAPVKIGGEIVWCPADETGDRAGYTMRYGFIDKTGKLVIPARFESAAPFSEGLAAIHQCDQSFFIDKTGKTVIAENYKYASSFAGGLAHVSILRNETLLDGYIDKTGKIVWGPTK
ncbi:MAG: WG repeat-containing protein [Pyrinomonadaceae bacterium]